MILYLNRQYFVKLQGEGCMDNIILRCDNNINGIFTAIYDAFVYKNQMQKEQINGLLVYIFRHFGDGDARPAESFCIK